MTLPDRYVLYRREWDAAKQKWQKIPCDPHGMKIDPHQPECWMTHDEAAAHATWDESRPKAPYGVGFVFNGDGLFLLDLDDALMPDGKTWKTDADLLFRSFSGVLVEVSTSGNGLHIIGKCDPDQLRDRRNKFGNNDREFYMDGRFVALSKQGLTLRGDALQDQTNMLLKVVPQREFLGDLPDGRDPAYTGPEDDDELIAMMLRSGGSAAAAFGDRATIQQLWNADAEALGKHYPDPVRPYDASAADMALQSHLAFYTGKDMPRMERLHQRSGLMREKWAKRADYRRETVQTAARLCKKVYDRVKPPAKTDSPTGGTDSYLLVPDQMQYFAGCTYIREAHKILIPTGEMLKPDQFRAAYGGRDFALDFAGQKSTKNAFEAFTECRSFQFSKVRGVMFRPDLPFGEIFEDRVNMYIAHKPHVVAGDVDPFKRHLEKLFPDERDREIVTSYLAAIVQNPGTLFRWTILVQGMEGNGKTLIAEVCKYCLGPQFVHEPRQDEMTEKFNDWMMEKLLIVIEEAHARGRGETMDFLKPLITNRRFEYRGMGSPKVMRDRTFNWIFFSNFKDAIIKTRNDRRFSVFFTPQQTVEDMQRDGMAGRYFLDLYRWLENGGFAHVAHYLMTYDIAPEFNPAGDCHTAPITTSTDAAILASGGGVEAELAEAIDAGVAGFRDGWISMWHLQQVLKEQNYRITRTKLATILQQLGYESWGRAPIKIMSENLTRPMLWRKQGAPEASFEDYLRAQGSGYS